MSYIFLLLALLSIIVLIAGLINPSLFKEVFRKVPTRKMLATILISIFFILLILVGVTAPKSEQKKSTENVSEVKESAIKKTTQNNNDTAQAPKEVKAFEYQIIYEADNIRSDGGKSYYALIKKIDLSNDAFKENIKIAVDKIVKLKGEKISIEFIQDREALDLFYQSHYGKNTLGRILTKEEIKKIGTALVAGFSGQLETYMYSNTLDFFPSATKDNSMVGRFIETLEYNPKK